MRKLDPNGKLSRSNLTRRATNLSNTLGGWAHTAVNTIHKPNWTTCMSVCKTRDLFVAMFHIYLYWGISYILLVVLSVWYWETVTWQLVCRFFFIHVVCSWQHTSDDCVFACLRLAGCGSNILIVATKGISLLCMYLSLIAATTKCLCYIFQILIL